MVVIGSCISDYPIDVPRLPARGETVVGRHASPSLGGKGANQAVALARLGVAVSIVATVGDDANGTKFGECFRVEHVDCSYLRRDPAQPTGLGVPLVLPDGENAIVVAPAAALSLNRTDVRTARSMIEQATAVLMQLELSHDAAAAAVEVAAETCTELYVNAAPVMNENRELALRAETCIANLEEAAWLLGVDVVRPREAAHAARAIHELGPKVSVITLGSEGACAWADGQAVTVQGLSVPVIDSTGAGDAFSSGYVASRVQGRPLIDALSFANHCGAASCAIRGAMPSMPTALQVAAVAAASE